MSYPENSPYAKRGTRLIGPQLEIPKYSDPISDSVNANGWIIDRRIDEFGRITFIARKGALEIKLETGERKALPIKAIKDSAAQPWEGPMFIEVPDGQNQMSSSLPKDKFIERHYRDGSISTPNEYLDTLSEFKEIVNIISKVGSK